MGKRTMADSYIEQRTRHIQSAIRAGGWRSGWLDMWTYVGEAAQYKWATWMQCLADPKARLAKVRS